MVLWESAVGHPARMMTLMKYFKGSSALVIRGGFKLPDTNWKFHTDDTNSSRRFLKYLNDNFLVQILKLIRKVAFLDLLIVNIVSYG